jgi:hypothetical protein
MATSAGVMPVDANRRRAAVMFRQRTFADAPSLM